MARLPIPARSGAFVHLHAGQLLKIINTHGTQVVDTWAFAALPNAPAGQSGFQFRYLSMSHTRAGLLKLTLATNDTLRDNLRQPMLTIVEDTSGGVTGLSFASCDKHRYTQLGVQGYHASCVDNLLNQLNDARDSFRALTPSMLSEAVASAALMTQRWTPDAVNLFMNITTKAVEDGKGGEMKVMAPICPPGGYVVLRAEEECLIVTSACPMDLTSMYENKGAEYEMMEA